MWQVQFARMVLLCIMISRPRSSAEYIFYELFFSFRILYACLLWLKMLRMIRESRDIQFISWIMATEILLFRVPSMNIPILKWFLPLFMSADLPLFVSPLLPMICMTMLIIRTWISLKSTLLIRRSPSMYAFLSRGEASRFLVVIHWTIFWLWSLLLVNPLSMSNWPRQVVLFWIVLQISRNMYRVDCVYYCL